MDQYTIGAPGAGAIDFSRMGVQRRDRLRAAMERNDVDVVVLSTRPNVTYAAGSLPVLTDSSRDAWQPEVAVVVRGSDRVHLFTAMTDGLPADGSGPVTHPPLYPDCVEGARRMVAELRAAAGLALDGKVAFDDYTPALSGLLPEMLPRASLVDAAPVLAQARMVKTADEIECIKLAQAINETAMFDALSALKPGVRQNDLSGIFFERIVQLGSTGNKLDPIWMIAPDRLSDGPLTLFHAESEPWRGLAFPLPSTDQVLREGDVIMVDASIEYAGYHGDFGRTWLCSLESRPASRLLDQYRLWTEIFQAVLAECRPGRTGADLTRAALKAAGGKKRWPPHLWLAHGIGLTGSEYPLVGTSLGEEYDDSIVLAPGMTLLIEPSVFDDGVGGYRSEDLVVVTEGAPQVHRHFPYTPWGDR